jgi:hypothetical protein
MNAMPYPDLFQLLGRPLRPTDAVDPHAIAKAEQALDLAAPQALREFYLLAGNAHDFLTVYDQFLPPADWSVQEGKLVFVEENQDVVRYGVDCGLGAGDDPPVWITTTGDATEWHRVCDSCSEFIAAMLVWQASFGEALPHAASGLAGPGTERALAEGWRYMGTVNAMRAYAQPGHAACLVEWSDGMRVFVGALSDAALRALGDALGVVLESED